MRVVFPVTPECVAQHLRVALRGMNVLEKSCTVTTKNASTKATARSAMSSQLNDDHTMPLSNDSFRCCLENVILLGIKNACTSELTLDEDVTHIPEITKEIVHSSKLPGVLQ